MEGFGESMLVIERVCTIIPLLLIITLFMGKRSIGELPVFDFIIIITLGSVAILTLGLLQRVASQLSIVFRWFGRMVTFEPTVIFSNGNFHVKNIKKIRYSLDNVLHMLREKDVFDLAEIDLAIIEANGRLTVLKKVEQQVVTKQDLNIQTYSAGMALHVIVEGKIYPDVLSYRNRDEQWLVHELKKKGIASVASLAIEWKKAQSLCKTCMKSLCLIREHNGELGSYSWLA
ncbi:DUF421 domain-containing protein [Brevibacillus formosus]|uniref:DUF421 domain-containing protein n=1 Tax=Brevibacillus formosus TaxID=54913 RepID=UPI000B5A87A0|nr:DUF421 domain-containing protein [Brevibacillus formosus]